MVHLKQIFSTNADDKHKTYIIAEIGINHEGSAETCANMIRSFAKAGADAIKLQTVDASRSYAKNTESFKLFEKARLTPEETANMFSLARECGVEPLTTSGDLDTLEWVDKLNPVAHKISSGLLSCTPIIEETCKKSKPVLFSTGMAMDLDIETAVDISKSLDCTFAIFQCTSKYPCPIEEMDLAKIALLSKKFGAPVGLSDHSVGVEMAYLSVAAGARLVEKHVSFDNTRDSFDHKISLELGEFKMMVEKIRLAERAMGSAHSLGRPHLSSQANRFGRKLAAARTLCKGHQICLSDLLFMRFNPEEEFIKSNEFNQAVGKVTKRKIDAFQGLNWSDLL